MFNYEAAMAALTAPKRLKSELPIPYVLEKAGVQIENNDGRLTALCPFHPDSTPSLYVVDLVDTGWRWGCWSCGVSGDVIDLMRKLWGLSFSAAVDAGERAVVMMKAEDWQAPPMPQGRTWDAPWARQLLAVSRGGAEGVLEFVQAKGYPFHAGWLARNWEVGALGGELIVPHFDCTRQLVGMKHRRCDGSDHLFAYPGSKISTTLYGEWLDRPGTPVVLCEGESDTWVASWSLRETCLTALGLPTGAGAPPRPEQVARLAGRQVHLVFDGDDAGRAATQRWTEALTSAGC
ncbi:MAG TPA: CHC2 zinc finger domain-containing protein, partial [Acidimicrobiales bacterium]|nr:CHC2 zinc finger domain-containing protein [Acidimicrobiales bacterium]